MLQALRDKSSGWIATVVLGLLVIPFAFFGMEQYLFKRNETFVAKVEAPPQWWRSAPDWWPVRKVLWKTEEIGADEFRTTFEQVRQQQRTAQGERFDVRAFENIDSKRKILDGLIDQRVLRMTTAEAGIVIGDAQVREAIQAISGFQVDGKFDSQRYQLALQSSVPARTPRQFEQSMRDDLQQRLLPIQVAQSAFVTPSEIERLMKLIGEKRSVSFMILPPPVPDTAPVAAADIVRWYKERSGDFRAPETVAIEYVEIDAKALPAPAAASDDTLRQRYEQEKTRFVEPEQRKASHILIRVDANASPAAKKAAEQKAMQLATQAKRPGADFAALARTNSDDSSAAAGGDLGWLAKGATVAPFEQALFAMQPGEIRGPIKTEFGWHVIQLREIKTGQQKAFEDAREELAREQAETDRERAFNDLIGKLVDQVYKNPTSLAPAARAVNLPVQKLGPFARGQGTGIAANPAVQRAAFSEALTQDGTISDPIEIAPNRNVLIRVTQHTPERTLPLSQVGDRVVAAVRAERMKKAAINDADALVARLATGESLAVVAASRGMTPVELPAVPRGAPAPDQTASEAYFNVPAPAPGKVSPGRVATADGRMLVFAVNRVIPGDPKTASPEQRAMLLEQMSQLIGNEDATALIKAQRKRMKVTVAEQRL